MAEAVLNRAGRRRIEKTFHTKATPLPLIDKGDCWYCSKKVMVAQGQLYTLQSGQPSHKICRD